MLIAVTVRGVAISKRLQVEEERKGQGGGRKDGTEADAWEI